MFLAAFCRRGFLLSSLKEGSKKRLFDFCFWREILRPAAVGLTSFVTERSKQERCHRFDAVDADQGAKPPGPRFYPAHPAGRGYTPYCSGKRNLIGPTACKEKVQFAAATRNVSPGLQGKAGSRRWLDGLPFIGGGGLGGKAPKSSSTRSKGWRLSWFFFFLVLLSATKEE